MLSNSLFSVEYASLGNRGILAQNNFVALLDRQSNYSDPVGSGFIASDRANLTDDRVEET